MEEKYSTLTDNVDPSLEISASANIAEGSDFCLLSEDDIEMEDTDDRVLSHSRPFVEDAQKMTDDTPKCRTTPSLDVETMKRKAEEIALSLRKFRSNRSSDINEPSEDNYDPPEELKHYRERSVFVAQKLKEDRLLFEESKKRNEAVVDKVRTVKQIHKSISESAKELRRDDPIADETMALRVKIERLEASLSHIQNTLASKNKIIFENKETIRTLNESVDSTRTAYLSYVEQSQEEIQQLRDEHVKALEKITKSRDEYCNQLQTVRKRCLLLENDLKLSEFARFKFVSRNAELRERVCQLETELRIPHTKSMSMEDFGDTKSDISVGNHTIATSDLYPKIECLSAITNEFYSYLVDFGVCDSDEPVELDEDCDPLQSMDRVGDRLESVFYIVRDKLSNVEDLETHTQQTEEKLRQLEALVEENKTQDAKHKKIIATMKAKIQSETNINKDLTEQLSRAQEIIKSVEQSSEQNVFIRCQELERANQQLQYELSALQNEPPSHILEAMNQLQRELEAKTAECVELRRIREQLEDSNDKLENDFVVLQKRDCDEEENWKRTCAQLKEENVELHENMRSMVEKMNDYENERLMLYQRMDELGKTVNSLTEELEIVNQQSFAKTEHDSEMQTEIENLNVECGALSRELEEVRKQLNYESSSCRDLREQMRFAENTNATLSNEMHDLQKRNQELETAKASLEAGVDELQTRINDLENERLRLQQCVERSNDALSKGELVNKEREAELEHGKNYSANLLAEIEKLRAEKEVVVAEMEQFKMKVLNDEVSVEALRRANEELTSSVRQLRQSISEMEDEKEQLASQYETQFAKDMGSIRELDNLKSQLKVLHSEKEELEGLQSQVQILESEKQQLLGRYEQYRDRLQILESENEQLKSAADSHAVEERVAKLETEKRQLEDACDKLKSKYQRLQLYCKANINKTGSNDGTNADVEKWRIACTKAKDELTKAQEREVQLKKAFEEQREAEIETWKRQYNEINCELVVARQEIDDLKQLIVEYETQFQKGHEVADEQSVQATSTDDSRLLDMESAVDVVVNECMRRNDEDVQKMINEVVNECIHQTDDLRHCINELKEENNRLREQYMEMEHCQKRVNRLQEELQSVRLDYNNLERRFYNMDEESGEEIAKYQQLLTEARSDLRTMEECLEETRRLLQQKDSDFQEYRSQMEEFVNFERARYEQRITDLDSNVQRTASVDAVVQTDSDAESEKQPATISKYFDYYKGKIAKEITNVLQPEEQTVDYSNWILPEKQDAEYQTRYQPVPEFLYEGWEQTTNLDKSSQTQIVSNNQSSQTVTSSPHEVDLSLDATKPSERLLREKLSVSQVVSQLRELIVEKTNGDEWAVNDADWSADELDVYNENYVSTSFKFVDLFEAIVRYYSTMPQAEILLSKFKNIFDIPQPEGTHDPDPAQWDHSECYNQLVTLCTHLECENKYLVDAVTSLEGSILARQTTEIIRFPDILLSWRANIHFGSDIIDRVCEEYDILPSKFSAGASFTTWKETMLKSVEFSPYAVPAATISESASYMVIEPGLVTVMKKNHKLIGDLYYKYGADKNFDPNEFFDQIEDINQDVERLVKFVKGEVSEAEPASIGDVTAHPHTHDHDHGHEDHHHDPHHHDHDHEDHHHDHHHHDHDDDQHEHETHRHFDHVEPETKVDDSVAVMELKSLLAESNKKIDSLVRELMEAKNSKDYNEMRQLHAKLDETLYQLHLRDVHNAELTQELTQLLSERDALQLKLSSIIRQYEELRQAFVAANQLEERGAQLSDVSEKLQELNKVNYMKDPRISEVSKQYHAAGMQLFNDDSVENTQRVRDENTSGFSVPSLFKWITGESDNK